MEPVPIQLTGLAVLCFGEKAKEPAFFGSHTRPSFRPKSDVELLVTFKPNTSESLFAFARMREELVLLSERDFDLGGELAVHNPFMLAPMIQPKRVPYAS